MDERRHHVGLGVAHLKACSGMRAELCRGVTEADITRRLARIRVVTPSAGGQAAEETHRDVSFKGAGRAIRR